MAKDTEFRVDRFDGSVKLTVEDDEVMTTYTLDDEGAAALGMQLIHKALEETE